MSRTKWMVVLACVVTAAWVAGCSLGSAASGGRMAWNVMKKDTHLKIYLDGQKAKQSKLKKAVKGHSTFKIDDPVSPSPTFKFEFDPADYFGRITFTTLNIFQEYEGDYSHQAEFIVTPADNSADAQFKPNTDYNLGSPGAQFKVLDVRGNPVGGVTLLSGMKYRLMFTVRGDRSETAIVEFETN